MAKFLWACFDGGGNVPPSLGITDALLARGHEVTFVGRRAGRATRTDPLPGRELTSAYHHADRYESHPRGRLFAYLTSLPSVRSCCRWPRRRARTC